MPNHPNRSKHAAIRAYLRDLSDVERVRYVKATDEWNCYGRMPNSIETGWWFAGYTSQVSREIAQQNEANR